MIKHIWGNYKMLFSEIKNWQIIVNKVKLQHVNLNAHHVFGEYAEVDLYLYLYLYLSIHQSGV